MRHDHAADAAHGQSTPAPQPAAVEELHTIHRPEVSTVLVPVEVRGPVATLPRATQLWETWQVPVPPAVPLAIANKQDTRRTITLHNIDAASIFIGPRSDVSPTNGYCLKSGDAITLTTRSAIYGVCSAATNVLAVSAEYEAGAI